jgi:hypothetical protein
VKHFYYGAFGFDWGHLACWLSEASGNPNITGLADTTSISMLIGTPTV